MPSYCFNWCGIFPISLFSFLHVSSPCVLLQVHSWRHQMLCCLRAPHRKYRVAHHHPELSVLAFLYSYCTCFYSLMKNIETWTPPFAKLNSFIYWSITGVSISFWNMGFMIMQAEILLTEYYSMDIAVRWSIVAWKILWVDVYCVELTLLA